MEEAYDFDVDTGMEGNFINGFYESTDIRYGEANFGSPLRSQTLLNLPNMKETKVCLDGEEFSLLESCVSDYKRTLYLKEGIVRRSLVWTTKTGKQVQMDTLRLVSFDRKHVMLQKMCLTALNFDGEIEVIYIYKTKSNNTILPPQTNAKTYIHISSIISLLGLLMLSKRTRKHS